LFFYEVLGTAALARLAKIEYFVKFLLKNTVIFIRLLLKLKKCRILNSTPNVKFIDETQKD
jgi:hypothetical protein